MLKIIKLIFHPENPQINIINIIDCILLITYSNITIELCREAGKDCFDPEVKVFLLLSER